MTDADLRHELTERLLWNDPKVRRVKKRPAPGGMFQVWCGCKAGLFSDRALVPIADALPVITCVAHRHTEGWVWIGKCPECDLIVFYTERGKK